jgi:hypothetical protein
MRALRLGLTRRRRARSSTRHGSSARGPSIRCCRTCPSANGSGQLTARRDPNGRILCGKAAQPVRSTGWCNSARSAPASGQAFDTGDLCAVAYGSGWRHRGGAWFHAATVRRDGKGLHWEAVPVTLERHQRGSERRRGASCIGAGHLIASDRRDWPTGDVSITPEDILITP